MNTDDKLKICASCEFHKDYNLFGKEIMTCGTLDLIAFPPIIGETVLFEGKEIKLCGCVMNVKSLLGNFVNCPANKW